MSEKSLLIDPVMVPMVGTIYEAALDSSKWPHFLAQFAAHFRSEQALIWAHDFNDNSSDFSTGPTSLTFTVGLDGACAESYGHHYCHQNVWLRNENLHYEGQVLSSAQTYPIQQLPRTEWYADWLRPQDLFYSFAAVVEKRAHRSLNVTALRNKRAGTYSELEMDQLRTLMPHLQTSFALHRRLHRTLALAHASLELLDRLPLGIVLLDDNACVLHANRRALDLTRQKNPLIRIRRGLYEDDELHAVHGSDDLVLQRAMHQAVTTGRGLPVTAGKGLHLRGLEHDLHLLVTPLAQHAEPFGTASTAAVFISDPSAVLKGLDAVLRMCYRLTVAESLLAQSLVNGMSLSEYASERELSVHTIRTQLKAVALKVGANRQADIVRTILNGPAMFQWSMQLRDPIAN